MLEVCLLGPPRIAFDGRTLSALSSSLTLTRLLAFLVTHRDQPQSRSCVAATFWPELSELRARRAMNNVFWRLRSALSECDARETYLLADNATIQFNPHAQFRLDLAEFEDLTDAPAATGDESIPDRIKRLEYALKVYRGDFLEGISDDWCQLHRQRLRERLFDTLEAFVVACRDNGRVQQAIESAQRLTVEDAYRERGHQLLIELYIASNRLADARLQWERYCRIWRDDLRVQISEHMFRLQAEHGLGAVEHAFARLTKSSIATTHPSESLNREYLRRELEILRKQDELLDLKADRKRQRENLILAQSVADQLNDPDERIDILARRVWLGTRQGEYVEAIELAQQALSLSSEASDLSQRPLLHRLVGIAAQEMGDFYVALHHYTQALKQDEKGNIVTALPADLNNVASIQIAQADYLGAIGLLERAAQLLDKKDDPSIRLKVAGNLGTAWMRLGVFNSAQRFLDEAVHVTQIIGARCAGWWLIGQQATMHYLCGRTDDAFKIASAAYSEAEPTGDAWVLSHLADVLTRLHLHSDNAQQAIAWANSVNEQADRKAHWRYKMRAKMRLAQAYQLAGQSTRAYASCTEAMRLYESKAQDLEESPELFVTVAMCAVATNDLAVGQHAWQRAEIELNKQISRITEPTLQESFTQLQTTMLPQLSKLRERYD
ncbi:MAG: hypothetical protein KatS3mg053_2275 [Candidatus Roseilinea sp.]|nr:MAG: hypothetical protein KatS3mg053_2275 [Candidatus Roseilinea sp.]